MTMERARPRVLIVDDEPLALEGIRLQQNLEARLDPEQFVRVHRSAIVNQRRIKELQRDGRELLVRLEGGAEIRVAPSHREKLERIFRS